MKLLLLLRVLTLAVNVTLGAGLLYLVVRRGRALSPGSRSAWWAVTAIQVTIAIDYTLIESLILWSATPYASRILEWVYYIAYLLNSVLGGVLPYVIMTLLFRRGPTRALSLFGAGCMVMVAVAGAFMGALESWDSLLETTRVLSFMGIAGYLAVCGFMVLGRLPQIDAYLGGFILIGAVFHILLPIQEVFFQYIGRESAVDVWSVLQFLQFATGSAQFGCVLALINTVRPNEGRGVGPSVWVSMMRD